MSNDLEWSRKMSNERNDELEVRAEANDRGDELYTLHTPAYREGGTMVTPSETICLTGDEFDRLADMVATFRAMKTRRDAVQNPATLIQKGESV